MVVPSYYVMDSYLVIIYISFWLLVRCMLVGLTWVGHGYGPIPKSRIIQNAILFMFKSYLTYGKCLEVGLGIGGGLQSQFDLELPITTKPWFGSC